MISNQELIVLLEKWVEFCLVRILHDTGVVHHTWNGKSGQAHCIVGYSIFCSAHFCKCSRSFWFAMCTETSHMHVYSSMLVYYCKCNSAILKWRNGSYYTCRLWSGMIMFMFYKDKYAGVKILILHPVLDIWYMIESSRLVSLSQCSNWLMPFKKRQIPVLHCNRVPRLTQ